MSEQSTDILKWAHLPSGQGHCQTNISASVYFNLDMNAPSLCHKYRWRIYTGLHQILLPRTKLRYDLAINFLGACIVEEADIVSKFKSLSRLASRWRGLVKALSAYIYLATSAAGCICVYLSLSFLDKGQKSNWWAQDFVWLSGSISLPKRCVPRISQS